MQIKQAIESVLKTYETALNASDLDTVIDLYTADGVFMPEFAPSAVGIEAVKVAYTFVFTSLKLNVTFQIDEIEVHGDIAFARTISSGEQTILAETLTTAEENRELFIFKNIQGTWKIARYLFNKMSPQA